MTASSGRKALKALRSFLAKEDGTSTIEFVVMLPLFSVLLLVLADASLLFLRHTTLMNISRDTARIVSRDRKSVV